MQMRKLSVYLLSFFAILCTSCKNEINIQLSNPLLEAEDGQVSRGIILPANTKTDTTDLEVLTAVGSATPVNSTYVIDTSVGNAVA